MYNHAPSGPPYPGVYPGLMLRLYDTRTRRVREVRPAVPGHLRMYVCGPTVYRYAHVGNLRAFLLPDLIRRVATLHGMRVTSVQNITDVGHLADDADIDPASEAAETAEATAATPGTAAASDPAPHPAGDRPGEDKVLAQARAEGTSPFEVARHYEEAFHRDLAALNIHPADRHPRASECIGLMTTLISRLLDLGHAYRADDGSVFFDARSFPSYGEISGNRLEELRPGHRTAEIDPGKRFHADWALWKAAGEARQMTWETPWSVGFPGWHVECSAMSLHYLGVPIDIHTGGIDLRFPHHEDERAQSNAVAGEEVVGHWAHGEHLLFEGRKMAKSAGNVVLLPDLERYGLDPLALRLALLEHHYRRQLNLTWNDLHAADRTLSRWRERVADWAESPSAPMCAGYVDRIRAAFDDDLDTPAAVRCLRELEKDREVSAGAKFEAFVHLDRLFGLDVARDIGKPRTAPLPAGARELLDRRARARAGRDFAASDRLRDELSALGVQVSDTPEGQTWTRRLPRGA